MQVQSAEAIEYVDCISAEESDPHHQEFPGYDNKLHLMVRLQSWNYFFRVYSDPKWLYLLGYHQLVKQNYLIIYYT